jgi:hypothetical protein
MAVAYSLDDQEEPYGLYLAWLNTWQWQEQGFNLTQRPLHKIEREREEKSALIREESDSSDIQNGEKMESVVKETGDWTCLS